MIEVSLKYDMIAILSYSNSRGAEQVTVLIQNNKNSVLFNNVTNMLFI